MKRSMLRKLRQKSYVQAQSAHRGLTLLEVLRSGDPAHRRFPVYGCQIH